MTRKLKIDVWTDTVCPWCLIGSVRLDKAIAALPDDVAADVENHPFYLDPDTPPEGYDVGEMLRSKYGREPREIWARAEQQARLSGIDLDLSQQPRTYPTRKDHTLVRLARVKGTQHALANAIAWAYFMEHRATSDEAVLAEIATGHGYARKEALQVMRDPDALGETHDLATAAAMRGDSRRAVLRLRPALRDFRRAAAGSVRAGAARGAGRGNAAGVIVRPLRGFNDFD